ncbi:MAG TPA: hypothetical protein VFS21_36820 [Roseiflexaceae bacterium]|nr:hypothetical protein [Roseiflexaceae bacterium]
MDRPHTLPRRARLWHGVALLLAAALLLPAPGRAKEPTPTPANRAGLVVRHGDGRIVSACVAFAEQSISGLELLQRSGLSLVTQGSGNAGAAVCKIDGEGCDYPTEDCFCKRDGAVTTYWAYHRLREGAWAFSPLGASGARVQPGEVDGWAWGTGSVEAGAEPPLLSFAQVCPAVAQAPPTVAAPSATAVQATASEPASATVPTPAAAASDGGTSYLAFGALALLLLGGIALALRRKRG